MPSRPIQVIAPGLLGYLQLKAGGANPDTLLDEVRPTIDMREWLLTAQREFVSGNAAVNSPGASTRYLGFVDGGGNAILIPPEEIWYVWNASIVSGVPAADTFNGAFGITVTPDPVPGPIITLAEDLVPAFTSTGTGSLLAVSCEPRRWFVSPCEWGCMISDYVVAAGASVQLSLEITRARR